MPSYTYRCLVCDRTTNTDTRADRVREHCPTCGTVQTFKRVWGFQYHPGYSGGFNPAVGKYVTNDAALRSELSRASDEASANTGMEHRFVPIDLRDPAHRPPSLDP